MTSAGPHPRDFRDDLHPLVGDEGFARLTAAFYARVRADELLAPMYPGGDFEGAEARLRAFLTMRFGGPDDYLRERGHPRLRRRHAPFPLDRAARDRWVELMSAALDEAALPAEADASLRAFFDATATFLINR